MKAVDLPRGSDKTERIGSLQYLLRLCPLPFVKCDTHVPVRQLANISFIISNSDKRAHMRFVNVGPPRGSHVLKHERSL